MGSPLTPRLERAIDTVKSAIAEDAGWTADEDLDMAEDTAQVAVRALVEAGLLDPVD